jgi:cytidine deaminase
MEIGSTEKRLLEAGTKAMKNAYVLRGCSVGVAVLGEEGEIYEGCNGEGAVSRLGTCAEKARKTTLFCTETVRSGESQWLWI